MIKFYFLCFLCVILGMVTNAQAPANDNICNAITLTLNGSSDCQNTAQATVETNEPTFGGTCSTPNNTVWYTYTPAVSGPVQLTMSRNAAVTTNLSAWVNFFEASGSCPSLSLTDPFNTCTQYNLVANNSVTALSGNLVAGTTYYIMIDGVSGASGGFCIGLSDAPAPPANDECVGAITLQPGIPTPGTSVGATESLPALLCNGFTGNADDDVWYAVAATANGDVNFTLTPNSTFDAVLEAFSGTCTSLSSISCADAGFAGDPETISLTGLAPGEVVYIRLYSYDGSGGQGTFTVTANQTAPNCTTLLLPTDNATNVTAPATDITWNSVSGATGYDVYLDTNNPPTTLIGNTIDTTTNITALAYNTTYYWTIQPTNGGAAATGCTVFTFTTGDAPPGPANDNICDAIPLVLNGPSDCQTTESATVETNEPTYGCSTPNNTTWYTYTPTVDGPVKVTVGLNAAATTPLDAWVSFFTPSGSCPSVTLTEAFVGTCENADLTTVDSVEFISQSLTAGTTYYIMVDGVAGAVGGYCIKLSDAPIPPAGPVNDSICNAIPLVLDGPSDCQTTETATTESNEPTYSCSTPNNTVWYTYTPAVSGPVQVTMKKNTAATTNLNAWVNFFEASGSCPSLTLTDPFVTCSQYNLTTNDSVTVLSGSLVAGTTYYLMVDGVSGAVGGFCINISTPPPAPPCTTLLLPTDNATNVAAPAADFTWNSAVGANGYDVYLDTNNPPTTLLGNTVDTTVNITGLAYNTTYYWTVNPTNNGVAASGCTIFTFITDAAPAGPVNDSICNAIPLVLNGPSDCQTTENATVETNEPTYGCSTPNNTTWYTYTPTVDGPVKVTVGLNAAATTPLDAWVSFFTPSGSCPSVTLTEAFVGTCENADLTAVDSVEFISQSLTAGTTYYIMVDGVAGAVGGYCIKLSDAPIPPAGPVNDSICNAIPLVLNGPSDCQTTENATVETNEPTYGCSTPNNTTWYTYTPTVDGPVKVTVGLNAAATTPLDTWVSFFTPSGSCPSVTLTEAFAGTCENADLTAVDSVEFISQSLTAGTTYYIMVDGVAGAVGGYCIKLSDAPIPPAGPVNDSICNAIPLVLNGPSDCQTTESATVETNEPTYGCSTPNNTVWYTYTPTVSGPIQVTMKKNTAATTNLNAWVNFFEASGSCPSLTLTDPFATCSQYNLTTNDSVTVLSDSLVAGTTYYIMVDGVVGAVGGFCINITSAPAAPPCTTLLLPTDNATNVTAPNTDFTWNSIAGANGYDVYLDTNNPPTTLLGNTVDTTVNITGLAFNTTYFWTVNPTNNGVAASGCTIFTFTTGAAPAGPVNDSICNAIPLILNGPSDCQTTESATTEPNEPTLSCSTPNNTTWYTYTPTVSGPVQVTMSRNTSATTNLNAWINFYEASGSCPSLTLTDPFTTCSQFNLVTNDSVTLLSSNLTAGTTYYIMVDGFSGAVGGYCIRISDVPPPPPNDDCNGATPLVGGVPTPGTTVSATESLPANTCNGFTGIADDDVWYAVSVSATSNLDFTLTPDGSFDAVLEAFTGTCGSLTSIGCADSGVGGDPETLNLTGLTAGQTVYIRVFSYDSLGAQGTFTVTSVLTPLPVKLISFKGERIGTANQLTWITTNEQNNKGFEIQRSADGENFSTLTFAVSKAPASGSTGNFSYLFTDEKPLSGTTYYRLKQVDYDGKSTLSNVIMIKGVKNTQFMITALYPNPVDNIVNLIVAAPTNDEVKVVITDLAGKIVKQQPTVLLSGDNRIAMKVDNLSKGTYVVKIVCSNGCEKAVSKFVKQ